MVPWIGVELVEQDVVDEQEYTDDEELQYVLDVEIAYTGETKEAPDAFAKYVAAVLGDMTYASYILSLHLSEAFLKVVSEYPPPQIYETEPFELLAE